MSCYQIDDSDPAHRRVLLTDKSEFLRQYYKFVRPGAIRIGATSQQGAFDPLAFINDTGNYVVVVKCGTGGEFSVGGLAAGTYGIKYTTASEFDVDLPDQTIYSGQAVLAAIPQAGVLTLYGKPTLLDDEPPSTPLNLTASEISTSRIALTWDASTDNTAVAGYRVYRNEAEIGFSPTTTYADTSIEPGIACTYAVLACDTAGNRSALSAPIAVTAMMPPEGSDAATCNGIC